MQLNHGLHLGYCTNIHRGENWDETFAGLRDYTLEVRKHVCPDDPYGIGLRLSAEAARELSDAPTMNAFRKWLDDENCYVFTINGFPYGKFHGTRVKEQVYSPDWTTKDRLDYTNLLFDILAELLPEGMEGSVSTLPGSFKEFITDEPAQFAAISDNVLACGEHVAALSESTGKTLHLGLEPEPLGYFETSGETVAFFERMLGKADDRETVLRHVGVKYDTSHLAVEYEDPADAIGNLRAAGVRISKLHLSSALKLAPTPEALDRLSSFEEDVYLHQVVIREDSSSELRRYRDLGPALALDESERGDEWRVHFHVPVHAQPELVFGDTRDHIEGILDLLKADPALCTHLEMETYTWEVLPKELHSESVVDQLVKEYDWCLDAMRTRGLVSL